MLSNKARQSIDTVSLASQYANTVWDGLVSCDKKNVIHFVAAIGPALLVIIYGKIALDLLSQGFGELSWEYLIEEPSKSGRAGGVLPILVSTVLVVGTALLVAIPMSVATALFVTEYLNKTSRTAGVFRCSMLILAGMPSVAFGLFGNVVFCQYLGMGNSIMAGGLTLSVMILPICAFTFEEVFRLVPPEFRYGAHALGFSQTRIIFKVIIPVALPGLIAGVLLGTGRALSETAVLLFTSGYSDRMPTSLLDPGRVLSIHIYDLAMNIPGGESRAAAAAILLIGVFMVICSISLLISNYAKK